MVGVLPQLEEKAKQESRRLSVSGLSQTKMAESKPNVLILGGCGFIGRNLVKYLVDNSLAKHIRVVDKVLPTVAYLSPAHKDAFASPIVKFKQGNAQSPVSLAKIFTLKNGEKFEYVFNLASETKYNEEPAVYEERVVHIAKAVIEECKKHLPSLKRIIEVSTAQVYEHHSKASAESAKIKPWTTLAEYKLKAEELWLASGLPVVILRPATVYGPGDSAGLMPRITMGRVYKFTDEKMRMLWGGDLKMNTVHVSDVCRAMWHLTSHGNTGRAYNLADKNDTDQKKFNAILEKIFGIRTGFFGAVKNKFAKLNLKLATEYTNDMHLPPWAMLCSKFKIESTPISPYVAPALLYDRPLSVDGTLIENTGFEYKQPLVTEDLIREELDYWIVQKVFPPNVDDGRKSAASEDTDSDDDEEDEDK